MATSEATSAVDFAAQTGRLDLLTAVLAVLALLLGLTAFPVFFYLRKRAEEIAKEAAAEALAGAIERVEAAAISRMEGILPTLLLEYRQLAENAVDGDEADQIAAAYDANPDDEEEA